MTIFVSSCRNKLTKKYAKKNGTPCIKMMDKFMSIPKCTESQQKQSARRVTNEREIYYGNV